MKSLSVLCLTFVGLLTVSANAATITSTFQFTASGTIGSQTFTNAMVTLTAVGDTLNRSVLSGPAGSPVAEYSIANGSGTVSISGIGTFQFTQTSIQVEDCTNFTLCGNVTPPFIDILFFSSAVPGSSSELLSLTYYPVASPWDMTSSFGPLPTIWNAVNPNATASLSTSGGTLTLNAVNDIVSGGPLITFQATVSTPFVATPAQLNLSYQQGGVPAFGAIQVTGIGIAQTFSVTSDTMYLSVSPTSGTAPIVGSIPVTVSVNSYTLPAGTYSMHVYLLSPYNEATTVVPVNVTVLWPYYTPYDLNGDGVVNIVDIQLLINAALGAIGSTGQDN